MSLAPSYSKLGHNSRTEKAEKVQTKPSLPFKDRNRGDGERDKNYNHEKTREISNTKSKHSSNVDSDESEAEQLLARLKAL
jgi:hypothetical protein